MKSLLLILALSLPFSACAGNNSNVSQKTKLAIGASLEGMPIGNISITPIDGLYEVQSGDKIYYTNSTGEYLISGRMYNTADKTDITAARLAEMNRINWSDLPLQNAIVSGPEDGLKMAVFTDPDCPYCIRLEKNLKTEKDIRVYTFLFPLTQLHPDAYEKSKSIWCAKDQHQAMTDVMIDGKALSKATCKTPVDDNMKLAAKLNVMGTPTIFAEDGRKYAGGDIKEWLLKTN